MNKKMAGKSIHRINILLVFIAIVIGVVYEKYFLIPVICIYAISISLTVALFKHSFLKLILSFYLLTIGPIELLLLQVSPVNVLGLGYSYYFLMDKTNLYYEYAFLSIGMYELILIFYSVFSKITGQVTIGIQKQIKIQSPINNNKLFVKYITIISYITIQLLLRRTFYLDMPGKVPVISGAGIIVYSYRFIGILLMYRCLCADIHIGDLKVSSFLLLILDYILICIPDIMLDRRGPVLYSLFVAFSYIICINPKDAIEFGKKNKTFVIILIVSFATAFAVFSSMVRYRGASKLSPLYIFSRLTGVADGFIGINYRNENNFAFFSLLDYFNNVKNMSAMSANSVYTRTMLGYASTAVHSSSLPLFVGSLMYDGYAGYIMISAIFGLIFSIAKKLVDSVKKGKIDDKCRIRVFVGVYIIVYGIARIMGGGSERLVELFVLPIMLLLYSLVVKDVSNN